MAERAVTSAMLAALADTVLRPALLYEGEFVSGGLPAFLRLWTGVGSIQWDGKTWTGGGDLLAISPLKETTGLEAVGFSVTVSALPSANLSLALQSLRQGKPGRLWLGLFDAAGALIADPYPLRRGRLDVGPIDDSGETATITVQYEDRLIDLETPRERRYTTADQALDYPGDLGFEFVPSLQDITILWGQ